MGPCRSRLSGSGGMAWHWHAGHSERASMFSPYMMLHVLFFQDLLWDVEKRKMCLLGVLSVASYNLRFTLLSIYQYY